MFIGDVNANRFQPFLGRSVSLTIEIITISSIKTWIDNPMNNYGFRPTTRFFCLSISVCISTSKIESNTD